MIGLIRLIRALIWPAPAVPMTTERRQMLCKLGNEED